MGACCGRPTDAADAACSQLAAAGLLLSAAESDAADAAFSLLAAAGLLLSAADWALLRGRGVMGAAAVLALGDEGLGCARALQLRSDPSCFSTGVANVIRATCDLLRITS